MRPTSTPLTPPRWSANTPATVFSAAGSGAEIGIRCDSTRNTPEPELVAVVDPAGEIKGVTLGNDVKLRDFEDRDAAGQGFTHKLGDLVTISCPELGALTNRVTTCDRAPPWTFGSGVLMRNLAARGLLSDG